MQKKTAFAKENYYAILTKFLQLNRLFIMKLSLSYTVAFMFGFSLLASTRSSGQNLKTTRLTLAVKHEPLRTALQKLQARCGLGIFYSSVKISAFSDVSTDNRPHSIAELLDMLLKNTNLEYRQEESAIIITEKKTGSSPLPDRQQKKVLGIVTDEKGQPIPGVNVRLRLDLKNATSTDQNGRFQIDVENDDDFLLFSFVGYQPQEISVKEIAATTLKVLMKPMSGSLNEVQIIGYGTTSRRLNTGSVSSISSEELAKETVSNPIQALAGRIPGMTISINNGNPGSNQSVNIRGVNNLGSLGLSGSLPLFIIDGVPFTNFNANLPFNDNLNSSGLIGAAGGLTAFSSINPLDIDRIDVLKDADATAIYGSRGANGVILITTKKGKEGKAQLNVNLYSGIEKVGHYVDMLNTKQYLDLRREAFKNDGVTANTANAPDLLSWDTNADTDFQKLLIGGTGHLTDGQLNYSGGNERIQFFASGNYHNEGSVYLGDYGDTRLIGRLSLSTSSLNKRFKAGFSINYTDDQSNLPISDVSSAMSLPPNYPLYNADGSLFWGAGFTNPMATLLKTYKSSTQNLIANGNLDYNFGYGFHAKLNAGYTRNTLGQRTANPLASQNPASATSNSAAFANIIATNYIAEPQLDYSIEKGKHKLLALAGGTFQQNTSDATTVSGTNYAFESLLTSINAAGTVTALNSNSLYKYAALFGKLNYGFDNKYLLNLTFRRDASSRFGPSNRFANFGAVGAAWIFSDESFMKNRPAFLSFGKLRASYGTTGNDQLPNYAYLALYDSGTAYQNSSTLIPSGIANPNLKWETTRKLEIGLDLGFFNDRILLTADAYMHRSGDLLTYANAPSQSGFNTVNVNLDAIVQNKGFELQITSTNIQMANFKWTSNFNISFQRNKMLSFADAKTAFYGTSFAVGYPVPPTFLYSYAGVDPSNGKAVINDLDGNSAALSLSDRYILDLGNPYYGGLNNTFRYKQFTLDFFLQFNHRIGIINQINGIRPGSLNNQNISVLNRWRLQGDTGTLFPGASSSSGSDIYASYSLLPSSDFYYGDASWIKLRSASVSYTLPSALTNRIRLGNVRFFLQGQNLLTFAKNKYVLDPESGNALPPLRTIVAGLNFTIN
ncbi:SusC/RagA family TonB-linked outer membrane protein [Pedobacter miscanthi]|uniref:SusC/RagA family TonB-linked outer membrane protein n=1 Tax=Pedobacter miscanthi TaxID=2259170 RepID=UPI00292FF268|nr:SusC/RagA family TonB-linked outer membrane protein [Pedobacter miscanthi]